MNYRGRVSELRRYMKEHSIKASIITTPENQFYFAGFLARLYSRPIITVITMDATTLVVPALDEKHAKSRADVDEFLIYYEHPEMASRGTSYLDHVVRVLAGIPASASIGVEYGTMNYALVQHIVNQGFSLVNIGEKITQMRLIKDNDELDMLVKAAELCNLGVSETLKNVRAGISEIELDQVGTIAVYKKATALYPDTPLGMSLMTPSGIKRSEMPHVNSNTRVLEVGDGAIHSRHVILHNYQSELERTFFVGKPSDIQAEMFGIVTQAQRAAIDMLGPGAATKDVDTAARSIIQKAGYGDYFVHRTGHGLGISVHEGPLFRFDSTDTLKEGMVVTIEPAINYPGVGGFRHSDTYIITSNGKTEITSYSRELKDLTFC